MKMKNVFDEISLLNSFIGPGHHSTIGNRGTIIYKEAWCAKIIDFLLLWDFIMLHKTRTHTAGYSRGNIFSHTGIQILLQLSETQKI